MSRNLSDAQFEQVPMFDAGPEGPSDRNLYFHYTDDEDFGEWNPRQGYEMHLGTGKAAADRGITQRANRYGSGAGEWFDDEYVPYTNPGQVHVARLREPLDNTPETRMHDPVANALYNAAPAPYDIEAANRVDYLEQEIAGTPISMSAANERMGARRKIARGLGRGAYYENVHEDKGSTSIVVKEPARTLEHVATVPHTPEFTQIQPTEDKTDLPTGTDPDYAYGIQLLSRRGTIDEAEPPTWRSKTFYHWNQPPIPGTR